MVVEQQAEIAFGRARSQRTGSESADVCERMAVLERSLRNHIANESGSAVVKTPLLATGGGDVGHNLTGRNHGSTRASARTGGAGALSRRRSGVIGSDAVIPELHRAGLRSCIEAER
jgi:hypothetical protein